MNKIKEVEELFSSKDSVLRETGIYNSKDVRTFKCLKELFEYYMLHFKDNDSIKTFGFVVKNNFYHGTYLKFKIGINIYINGALSTCHYYDLLDINTGKYLKDNMYVKTDLIHEYAQYNFKQINRNYIIDNILNCDI